MAAQTTTAEHAEPRVPLPPAAAEGGLSVEAAIGQRRSVREFARRDLTLEDLSQLLWAAQGITDRAGYRSAPSAGALYPLEIYVVAGAVDGLADGLYHYRPDKHELVRSLEGDLRKPLAAAALHQDWIRRAPVVLVIAAVYERSAKKYGGRAERYTHMEVGHAAQNVYLQAGSRGLGTVFVGAFEDEQIGRILSLPEDQAPLGLMPVGYPR